MKKLILALTSLALVIGVFASVSYALSLDMEYEHCVTKGYSTDTDEELGEVCVFNDGTVCPLDEFYDEECGTDYQDGYECDDPFEPYQNECADPIPVCEIPIENAMTCIDKISYGHKTYAYEFTCYDGWEKVEHTYDDWSMLDEFGYCNNPCDDPLIPIDGDCTDPYPPCENPPEHYVPSSCIC